MRCLADQRKVDQLVRPQEVQHAQRNRGLVAQHALWREPGSKRALPHRLRQRHDFITVNVGIRLGACEPLCWSPLLVVTLAFSEAWCELRHSERQAQEDGVVLMAQVFINAVEGSRELRPTTCVSVICVTDLSHDLSQGLKSVI